MNAHHQTVIDDLQRYRHQLQALLPGTFIAALTKIDGLDRVNVLVQPHVIGCKRLSSRFAKARKARTQFGSFLRRTAFRSQVRKCQGIMALTASD